MLRALLLLLAGEALALYGLWLAWAPLSYVAAGGQLVAYALSRETGDDA